MAERGFTIIDRGQAVTVPGRVTGGRVWLSPAALSEALGWEVHDDLLCRDALCVPVPSGSALVGEEGVDLDALAALLDHPLALDVEERVAYLGVPARDRAAALASLEAPDFSLPDLEGRIHSLAGQRGRKVLLVAWGSW